jgi:hypothetical protein
MGIIGASYKYCRKSPFQAKTRFFDLPSRVQSSFLMRIREIYVTGDCKSTFFVKWGSFFALLFFGCLRQSCHDYFGFLVSSEEFRVIFMSLLAGNCYLRVKNVFSCWMLCWLYVGLIEVLYLLAGLYWHYFASINDVKSHISCIGCICIF